MASVCNQSSNHSCVLKSSLTCTRGSQMNLGFAPGGYGEGRSSPLIPHIQAQLKPISQVHWLLHVRVSSGEVTHGFYVTALQLGPACSPHSWRKSHSVCFPFHIFHGPVWQNLVLSHPTQSLTSPSLSLNLSLIPRLPPYIPLSPFFTLCLSSLIHHPPSPRFFPLPTPLQSPFPWSQ